MSETHPPSDLEAAVRQALRPPEPDPEFVTRLLSRLEPSIGLRRPARPVWPWAAAAAILLLLAGLLIGPSDLVAALQRLLGYIPGIGMVDGTGGLRLLAEPVTQIREGITLTVEQAVLDADQTVLVYQADGIPHSAYPLREDAPFCPNDPVLRLPDGTQLNPGGGNGRGWGSGFESRRVFPAIPADVDRAVFVLPCLMDTAPGAAPEDWEITLLFVSAPSDLTIAPVLEIPTPQGTLAASEAPAEMGLTLEQVIELDEAYILMGTFRQGAALPGGTVWGMSAWPEITNAAGEPWPFDIPDDLYQPAGEPGAFPWVYQVPKGFSAPLTITVQAVDVEFPADLEFTFDAGPDPQPEQGWSIDREFQIAGYTVRLRSVIHHTEPRTNGYEFFFEADTAVSGIALEDRDHTTSGGYGGGTGGEFSAGLVYQGDVPTGELTIHLSSITALVPGPWTLDWFPSETGPATATPPSVCLTQDSLQQALAAGAALPEALTGRLIAYGRITQDGRQLSPENAGIFVADLASGQHQIVGPGTWPALSADGRYAAYSGMDGLRLVDLATGENLLIPGTTPGDYGPRWAPDSARLAFRRVDDLNLYLINPDGSGLQRVTAGPEYELLVGWTPDGARLVYAAPGPEGLRLRSIAPAGAAPVDLFVIQAKDISASISPDGRQIAFMQRLPDSLEYGLYLAGLDGSQPRLIAQTGWRAITNPLWSPDGRWLLVNVVDVGPASAPVVPMLIDPSGCRAYRIGGIEGTVQDWSR